MDETVIINKNIVYGRADNEYLTADTYHCDKENLPVVLLVHGGAWQTGSKEMYSDWAQALAMEGYFVMAIIHKPNRVCYIQIYSRSWYWWLSPTSLCSYH